MASQTLPSHMKAWVLESFNTPYVLRELPIPTLDNPHDLLIRVDAASYCHTDAVLVTGAIQPTPLPHIGCHEFTGTVVSISPSHNTSHSFRIGDRVAVPGRGHHVCGQCTECQNPSPPLADAPGYSIYCPAAGAGLGEDKPGGFQQYASVDARQVALIPASMSATEAAPLMCAGLTVYTALRKCALSPGQRVGIVGCGGGLGHLGLQFATKMGLKTTGFHTSPAGLELSRSLDTSATILDPSRITARAARRDMGVEDACSYYSEMGLDAVLILPDSQSAFDYAIDLLKDGGRAVLLSFPAAGFHLSATDLVFRRLTLEGSLIGSNRALEEMLAFCVEYGVAPRVTLFPFVELNELVSVYAAGGVAGKLVLDMLA